MNCQNHPETPATAYCRSCGKPVCDACRRDALGTVYCAEHLPAPPPPPPPGPAVTTPPVYGATYGGPVSRPVVRTDVSPGLALFLGTIPGVGAIYNGQYAKGLVHAVIWGMLMSIADSRAAHGLEPVFVMLVIAWWAYMAFEAYHTARKRQMGEPVDEYSSIIDLTGGHNLPVAGVVLIGLGGILLLHTLDVLDLERVTRFWPVLLIGLGVYLLAGRVFGEGATPKETRHERL
jgi:Domain of unknown function (DUF5668)/B-box zinc finger